MNDHYATNFQRTKEGYRYKPQMKLFSIYMRILSGKALYNVFKANAQYAVPSNSAVKRYILSHRNDAEGGVLRARELLNYLNDHNLPKLVHLSEDATKITGKIQYNSNTNKVIGFVHPLSRQTGMPINEGYEAVSAKAMESCFYDLETGFQRRQASYINVVMAKPLANEIPAFCLLVFGTDGSYEKEYVDRRWTFMVSELEQHGITVVTIASDSDSRYNSVMRINMNLGGNNPEYPDWFNARSDLKYIPIQDTVHIGTKMRNRILDHKLKFGKHIISIDHVLSLLKLVPKTEHNLTENIIKTSDRQNFDYVLRICDARTIMLIEKHVKLSEGTVFYLKIICRILRSFLDSRLSPLERIRHIWFANFMLRIWREYLIVTKQCTLKDHFLSVYAYICVEINAHALILMMVFLKERNMDESFSTETVGSQPCEGIFRQIRALSTTGSTVVNCSLYEIIQRMAKIELLTDISHIKLKNFQFPSIGKESKTYFPSVDRNGQKNVIHSIPTLKDILNEVELAKLEAIEYAETLGVIVDSPSFLTCNINISKFNEYNDQNEHVDSSESNFKEPENINVLKIFGDVDFREYAVKNVSPDEVGESSIYVKIQSTDGNMICVKKHTLCWFLGQSTDKLSSDRLKRVMSR